MWLISERNHYIRWSTTVGRFSELKSKTKRPEINDNYTNYRKFFILKIPAVLNRRTNYIKLNGSKFSQEWSINISLPKISPLTSKLRDCFIFLLKSTASHYSTHFLYIITGIALYLFRGSRVHRCWCLTIRKIYCSALFANGLVIDSQINGMERHLLTISYIDVCLFSLRNVCRRSKIYLYRLFHDSVDLRFERYICMYLNKFRLISVFTGWVI